jgi:DNA polymerase-3 subunit beta
MPDIIIPKKCVGELRKLLDEVEGTVEVHLADAAAPTLLRENDASPALYVLMPMRV